MWVTVPAGVATVLQCANSLVRTYDAAANNGQWIQWLDSKAYYVWAGEGLDAMSLLGAAAAGGDDGASGEGYPAGLESSVRRHLEGYVARRAQEVGQRAHSNAETGDLERRHQRPNSVWEFSIAIRICRD
jgi:hypothetical protein